MRFLMINLLFVFLLLFGIGYLAFGSVETGTYCLDPPEINIRTHALQGFCLDISSGFCGVLAYPLDKGG